MPEKTASSILKDFFTGGLGNKDLSYSAHSRKENESKYVYGFRKDSARVA